MTVLKLPQNMFLQISFDGMCEDEFDIVCQIY